MGDSFELKTQRQRTEEGTSMFQSHSLTTKPWVSGIIVLVFGILAARRELIWPSVPWQRLDIPACDLPATYLSTKSVAYARVNSTSLRLGGSPDTTAIILNWSRLPNVIRIVSLLCSAQLEDTIKEVVVWNNSPTQIHPRDFVCSTDKLRIVNSPENLYFQARFIACAQASTPYCFIQDDDYLVYPEIIQSLRVHVSTTPNSSHGIHLLPPHEHLSSTLRTTHSSSPSSPLLHTSFAWLGHGTLLPRSRVRQFLSLMGELNATEDEMKMADNFFTILSNGYSEIWFDQGVELGGGEAFTVGIEGEERNRKYITRAGEYLDSLLAVDTRNLFVNLDPSYIPPLPHPISRTPCLSNICVLETNINLLPLDSLQSQALWSATDMLNIEESRWNSLKPEVVENYSRCDPSNAVDGRSNTAFCSREVVQGGDYISLHIFSYVPENGSNIEMAWLVDLDTATLLQAVLFDLSPDGVKWTPQTNIISCLTTSVDSEGQRGKLQECSIPIEFPTKDHHWRIRAKTLESQESKWCVYEIWLRTEIL